MSPNHHSCRRCGSCCRAGGPTLHQEDLSLLRQGHLCHRDLITVRRGEPTASPLNTRIEPSDFEFVKLAGSGDSWSCRFFNPVENGCTIYRNRPLECRLLECCAPEALLSVIGRHTLRRQDLINREDPVLAIIRHHEERCSFSECSRLVEACLGKARTEDLARLAELLQEDLDLRLKALRERGLPAEFEMFIFGRPLFFSVHQLGITVTEENGRLTLAL